MGHPVNHHSFHGSTASGNTFELIKWWIERCDQQHLACSFKHASHEKSRLPTRLIDVGTAIGATPRLCRGSTLPGGSKYVTLSHCWGSLDFMKLTTHNMTDLEAAISVDLLPKTFQDAILLTQQLNFFFGFRYLWIDSLCIIQNSRADWEYEALLMKDVYRQAVLNIAASSSSDGRGGCYKDRDPVLVAPHIVDIKWDGYKGEYHLMDRYLWKDEVIDAPLGTRGWVLQERLLSTKKVYFGKNQVFWCCQEAQGCETYPHMLPGPIFETSAVWQNLNMWNDGVLYSRGASSSSELDEKFINSSYKLWDSIVQTYSSLKFTHSTDRLIALAGVAEVMSTMNHDEYLAGLWRAKLPRSLMWYVIDSSNATRPKEYIAPSWSWASIVGEVTCAGDVPVGNEGNLVVGISVVEVGVTSASASHLGDIISGFIKLRGSLMRVIVGADGSRLQPEVESLTERAGLTGGSDVGRFIEGQKLYCLPIYLQAGLCLELDGSGNGIYRRVGWWATDHAQGLVVVDLLSRMFKPRSVDSSGGSWQEVEAAYEDDEGNTSWGFSIS